MAPDIIRQNCASLQNSLFQYFENYSLRTEPYETSNPKELTVKSFAYCDLILENPNDWAHMASIRLSWYLKNQSWKLIISKTKTKDIIIPLSSWIQEEVNYQIPQIVNIIQHSYKLIPDWEMKPYQVTLLQTVRSRITDMASSNLDLVFQLTTVPSYEANYFTWYLKSKESYLGYINMWIEETSEEQYLKSLQLKKNHLVKLQVTTVKNGDFSTGTLEIPVISKSDSEREKTLKQLMNAFDFQNTFSNLKDLISRTENYLSSHMKTLQILPIDESIQESNGYFYQNFKLKHEFSSVEISFGAALEGNASSYYVTLDYEGNNFSQPFVSLYFRRMDQSSLEELYASNSLHKLFRTVYEDITDMFQNEYSQFIQKKESQMKGSQNSFKTLKEFHDTGGFNSVASDGFKNDDISLSYSKDKNGKVSLVLSSSKKMIEYKESFHFDKYKRDFIYRLIQNFFLRYEEDIRLV